MNMKNIINHPFIHRLFVNKLVKNTMWTLIGQGSRIMISAIYFIVIARTLGMNGYGAFVGVVALSAILSPFSSLGTGNVLVKKVARDQQVFPIFWGNALLVTFITGAVMIGVAVGLFRLFFPETISLLLIITIACSDLLFLPIIDLCCLAFQAVERMLLSSQLQVALSVIRMLCAISLSVFFVDPTPEQWGFFYLFATIISAVIGYMMVTIKLGLPSLNLAEYWKEAKEGIFFCMSQLAHSLNNDMDKSMMPKLSNIEASGLYASAYRIIDVAFIPVHSLLAASYSRFFKHGASGIEGGWKFTRKIFPIGCVFGLVAGVIVYFTAPFVPYILGTEYQSALIAIQWLAFIPFAKTINFFAADLLTGAGFQGYRSMVQFAVAFISIGLNLILIPIYSWKGAVVTGFAANLLLAFGLWTMVAYLRVKAKQTIVRTGHEPLQRSIHAEQ